MTYDDMDFLRDLLANGTLKGPVLNLGAGQEGPGERQSVESRGYKYVSTDIAGHVDFIANFETGEGIDAITPKTFECVWVCNVIEHTFEPLKVLDNALRFVAPGGKLVTITPCVWPIHNYPVDMGRPLPDFYIRYGDTRGITLIPELFQYIGYGSVQDYKLKDGCFVFPKDASMSGVRGLYSKVVHRAFNTFGRGMAFRPNIAISAIYAV